MEFASKFAYWNEKGDEDEVEQVDESDLKDDLISNLKRGTKSKHKSAPAPKPASSSFLGGLLGSFGSSSTEQAKGKDKTDKLKDKDKDKDKDKEKEKEEPKPSQDKKDVQKKKIVRRADTNVVAVKFGSLATAAEEIFSGDAVLCKGCGVALSATSVVRAPDKEVDKDLTTDEGDQIWKCEFCAVVNIISLDPEEIPKKDSRDYVLEPAPEKDKKEDPAPKSGSTIFCIDVSGSMVCTSKVVGKVNVKGKRAEPDIPPELREFVPRTPSTETWLTRLQIVQSSINNLLDQWTESSPEKRVGLVTFGSDVTVIGDATTDPEVIAGDKLRNQKVIEEIGAKHELGASGVKKTKSAIEEKLWALEEKGSTALGPALLVSVLMASKQKASQVMICTDGMANVGLGSLEGKTETEKEEVEKWYEAIGNIAKVKGVTVNVITIKGQECALEALGRVAEITGGTVDRVDPNSLAAGFKEILQKPTIATLVTATFIIHRGLKFRNEDGDPKQQIKKEIGNVNEDTEITFEYEKQDSSKLSEFKDLKSLPFQLQIHFTKLDGMKCLRVISKSQEITTDRDVAEKDVKAALLAANVAQQSARLAERGEYVSARAHNLAWGRLLQRQAKKQKENERVYNAWADDMQEFDQNIQAQQSKFESADAKFGDDDDEDSLPPPSSASSSSSSSSVSKKSWKSASKAKQAKVLRSDDDYSRINKFKKKNASSYTSWK